MSLLLLTAGLGFAEPKNWDDKVADVEATLSIPAPPEKIFTYLLDLRNLQVIFPADCVGKWELGERTFGEGASAYLRYDMGMMHRRLAMTLTHATGPTSIDFDHLGNKGFITRWSLTASATGTDVRVRTPLNPPPKPLKGYYFTTVQPEWQLCYQRTLTNLATEMAR